MSKTFIQENLAFFWDNYEKQGRNWQAIHHGTQDDENEILFFYR